jgi:hypothetical protein
MTDDDQRPGATTDTDLSRQVATTPDTEFTWTIDDAGAAYEHAGHPRTPRSIQRYCAKGHLDCRRIETPFGDKFLITPDSVAKHIAYIEEVRPVATGRDVPRQVAAIVAGENHDTEQRHGATTTSDVSQPVASGNRIIELLERENEFLREQVGVKDTQIAELQERAHETNTLINGLQRLLAPLLAAPDKNFPTRANTDSVSASE